MGLQFPLFTSKIIRSLAPCGLLWRRRGQAPKLRYNRKHQPQSSIKGEQVLSPLWELRKQLITVHPLGGCPIVLPGTQGKHLTEIFGISINPDEI